MPMKIIINYFLKKEILFNLEHTYFLDKVVTMKRNLHN